MATAAIFIFLSTLAAIAIAIAIGVTVAVVSAISGAIIASAAVAYGVDCRDWDCSAWPGEHGRGERLARLLAHQPREAAQHTAR